MFLVYSLPSILIVFFFNLYVGCRLYRGGGERERETKGNSIQQQWENKSSQMKCVVSIVVVACPFQLCVCLFVSYYNTRWQHCPLFLFFFPLVAQRLLHECIESCRGIVVRDVVMINERESKKNSRPNPVTRLSLESFPYFLHRVSVCGGWNKKKKKRRRDCKGIEMEENGTDDKNQTAMFVSRTDTRAPDSGSDWGTNESNNKIQNL